MIGLAEEYKHLVEATHSDDADFHSVVKLVQQGYKMRRSDWENGFVDMFVATEDIGQQRKTKDEDAEHGEDLNHSEDEEENKDEEEKTDAEENKDGEDKTDEEENKDEEYQKDKEHRKDKDHSMSNSEKLDKLIQMVRDLDKRVVVIQNVLGVKVDVKCILGDPELHSDLVEDVDCEFGRVVDLVKRGYRLKRQDWLNGSVDISVAEAEVDENNFAPGIDATDQEKIEFLTKKVVFLEEKVKYLEGLLNIRGETETEKSKETEAATKTKNADYELDETEVLQDYIDAKRQEIAKGKKNVVRPPREVDHQDEDDTEVEHGAKESDTSKVNEGHRHEEEEQQQEDDTKVNADVDVGAKESENPKTNEDGEVNEDACKKPVKGTKKRGRGTKGMKKGVTPPREVQQQVEDDAEVDVSAKEIKNTKTNEDEEVIEDASKKPVKGTKKRGTKGIKKCVTPPREVEEDAEVDAKESENPKTNEDGEVNENASQKHMKFTKINISLCIMEPNVDTSKSKRQKKQEDSATDAIELVLEDLKKTD
ncbi:unnamed protein product [Brassica napus]|uniref:(rape) hypothetical protein n=1 Tax=Brassica napus TaxID=3708 RepID=A0A816QFM8_BRANA|nr:unnamed protein product [Brassica napus]